MLFVGRITRQKGVTHLVEAIPHLPPGTQVVLCAGAPDTPEIASRDAHHGAEAHTASMSPLNPGEAESDKQPAVEVASDNINNPPRSRRSHRRPIRSSGHNIVWIEQMVSQG